MARYGKAEKLLYSLTAVGGLLVVVALALFAVSGSGFVAELLRGVAGAVLGTLTISPRRGRRVAALLLLASVVGLVAYGVTLLLSMPTAEDGLRGPGFVVSFLSWTMGFSLCRLLGIHPMGRRGEDQSSRRRV